MSSAVSLAQLKLGAAADIVIFVGFQYVISGVNGDQNVLRLAIVGGDRD